MYKKITDCRLCGNDGLEFLLSLGKQSFTGVFPREKPERVPSGPLELVKCKECDLVQLLHSYDLNQIYGHSYGYRSNLNQAMAKHLGSITQDLVKNFQPAKGDLVIDIGSNDATLLRSYPENEFQLLGIDPTGIKFKTFYPEAVQLIPDFFSAFLVRKALGNQKVGAKIITSIAMFYDLEDPVSFAHEVAEILANDGVWVFEQSYLPSMLDNSSYDTICHEHLEYYSLNQIKRITDEVGLKIIDLSFNDTNGGSFRVTAAKAKSRYAECTEKIQSILQKEEARKLSTLEPYTVFNKSIQKHRDDLLGMLASIKKQGKTIFGYGASTKGNVLLQYCRLTSKEIPYIVEVNEEKFGAVTPGTRIPIISEEEARGMRPDYFLVLPWHFRNEIVEKEKAFINLGGHLLFPFPKPQVVPS